MANERQKLNTRIALKYDTHENWETNKNFVLKQGEIAFEYFELEDSKTGIVKPYVFAKVGDDSTTWENLKYLYAPAADVYSWAKAEKKPEYEASEIKDLEKYIAGQIQDTDTIYRMVKVNDYQFKLQSKAKVEAEDAWSDVSNSVIDIPDDTAEINALKELVGSETVQKQIEDAIKAIEFVDYTVSVTPSDSEEYAKIYTIEQAATGLKAVINIPKDMMVSSGEVVENPEGQSAGTYIVLTLANATQDKIYINVADLIEYVTSGSTVDDQIQISIDAEHKVTATLKDKSVSFAQLNDELATLINEKAKDSELHPIAKSGKVEDLEQDDVLILYCGSSTEVI